MKDTYSYVLNIKNVEKMGMSVTQRAEKILFELQSTKCISRSMNAICKEINGLSWGETGRCMNSEEKLAIIDEVRNVAKKQEQYLKKIVIDFSSSKKIWHRINRLENKVCSMIKESSR